MNENKDFKAEMESDYRKAPVRVAFVTRRTSPAVKFRDEEYVMTFPETLLRAAVAIEVLVVFLVWLALLWNAPLEQLADPMHTPNPAKAPWYFLGLQELLHYFPPIVAGIIIPGLVVLALVVVPYFNVNIRGEPLWATNSRRRFLIFVLLFTGALAFLGFFEAWTVLVPTLAVGALILIFYFIP